MAWWGWLLVAWAAAATAAGMWTALALRLAEEREWLRRGGVDRRQHRREPPTAPVRGAAVRCR